MRRPSLLAVVLLAGCHADEPVAERAASRARAAAATIHLAPETLGQAGVEIAAASRSEFRPFVSAGGFIRPDARRSVTVRAPGQGKILQVAVDVGTQVKAGDIIVVIDSPEASAALARQRAASAREQAARRSLASAERLLAIGGISRAERDGRRAEADVASAEAAAARQELVRLGLNAAQRESWLDVATPIGGVVLKVPVVEGSLVEQDASLAEVADLSRVWALVETTENDATRVEPGTRVEVRCDGLPERAFEGAATLVEPMVDPAGRVRVRVLLDNLAGELIPGQFVTAELPLPGPSAEVTAVPRGAVQRFFGLTAVFVETGPGTFEVRVVETGRESGGQIEVIRGLRDGEPVVVDGAFALKTELLQGSLAAEEE